MDVVTPIIKVGEAVPDWYEEEEAYGKQADLYLKARDRGLSPDEALQHQIAVWARYLRMRSKHD